MTSTFVQEVVNLPTRSYCANLALIEFGPANSTAARNQHCFGVFGLDSVGLPTMTSPVDACSEPLEPSFETL
jgi:hypothetical protein